MTIDELGQAPDLSGRVSARQSVFFMASISRSGGPPLGQVKVRNISSSGLMAETGIPLAVGENVQLALRGIGPVQAVVVRRTPNRIAVQFDLPIDPLLTRQRV